MNRRHRDILYLILNTEECITGSELARLCNVTIRAIRRDIKEINNLLKRLNLNIELIALLKNKNANIKYFTI